MKLARSDSHSVRALRAVKSHPCGAGLHSNGRGAAPALNCLFSGNAMTDTLPNVSSHDARIQMRRVCVKHAGAAPHPSRTFNACPWKICVAASRLPCLLCLYADGVMAGECFPFLSCSWNFCVRALRIPYTILSLHDKAAPHTTKTFLDVCGSASVFVIREQRGAAEGATQNRTGIPASTSHAPGVRRRAVRAGRTLFMRPSSYPLPGPAPGCRPAIRKRDGAVPAEPQEAGRADASRSLYCFGGMSLCRFTSRCFRAGNYKLSGGPPRRQALFLPAGSFFLCYFPFFFGEEGK